MSRDGDSAEIHIRLLHIERMVKAIWLLMQVQEARHAEAAKPAKKAQDDDGA